MKICIFSSYYPLIKGGAEYQSKLLALEISRQNEVFFISTGHEIDEVIYEGNIKVYCLKKNTREDSMLLYYPFSRKMNSILDKERPNLIYQRVLNSFSFHLAKYSKAKKVPLFIHIADNYCLSFDKSLRSRIRKEMFKSIIGNDAGFITQTKFQSALLEGFNVKPRLQIHNMHNLPQDLIGSNNFDPKLVLWIGSARKVKQLELFIKLSQMYIEKNDVEFKIIGRLDNSEYNIGLKNSIDNCKNLEYLGEQSNEFVNDFLNKSYLLINTSVSEGFSNTFIQGWMRGVPVISLNSDPDDVIKDFDLGRVCYGDFDKLHFNLDELLDDFYLYSEISKKCRVLSRRLFSIEHNIKKITTVLGLENND